MSFLSLIWQNCYGLVHLYIFILTILLSRAEVIYGSSQNETHGSLSLCQTSDAYAECWLPFMKASVYLFVILFLIVIAQGFVIIKLALIRNNHRRDPETDQGMYSSIKQAEFISNLSGKLERNDSIGSSTLNFLAPDMTRSANSLCNLCSSSSSSKLSPHPRTTERQDTMVYFEISNGIDDDSDDGAGHIPTAGRRRQIRSLDSDHYAFIKSLSVEEKPRPLTYMEIPSRRNGILRQQESRCGHSHCVLTFLREDGPSNEPLNVTADVHESSRTRGTSTTSQSSRDVEDKTDERRDRLPSYLEIIGDENNENPSNVDSKRNSDLSGLENNHMEHISEEDEVAVSSDEGQPNTTYLEMTEISGDSVEMDRTK